ncbi:dihydroorotase [Crocinitomicaceae bacterium]|jgi:dihydroorotase|nr:dihydroorotase [Crocinitomicaceae bacterium]MDB4649078.1 dihydroorotase [Crocinitomicaceae bacterium]
MNYILKNGVLVNEGHKTEADILIKNGKIEKIGPSITELGAEIIDVKGSFILPGCIDDQVHFREPGLTHKASIYSESRAAVAGGITSYMEMPNTVPNATTQELLQDKYDIASKNSLANYSFFMGATNDNLEEVLKTDPKWVCGIKVFMGSSTGNMLVDNKETLEGLFSNVSMLIATHCEDEQTIQRNLRDAKEKYGEDIPIEQHPVIRNEEACYLSSSLAVSLAKKHNARLHVLHISTAKETELFDADTPLIEKNITAEACVHHLWFTEDDYSRFGTKIKWNPAVKSKSDREGIWAALLDNRIDVVATDHAPHTLEEKSNNYLNAPSGGPLVQHALLSMFEHAKNGKISIERIVEKMAHNPAILFRIEKRGYLREGYFADLVVVKPEAGEVVAKENILYQCQWSPFEGTKFSYSIDKTFVNGSLVYDRGQIIEAGIGNRLSFNY